MKIVNITQHGLTGIADHVWGLKVADTVMDVRHITATWWRSRAGYKIENGYIVPVSEEIEAYDPWEDYRNAHQRKNQEDPVPYQQFVELARVAPSSELSRQDEHKVLSWCLRYGVLCTEAVSAQDLNNPKFWTNYREPLQRFLEVAKSFEECLTLLSEDETKEAGIKVLNDLLLDGVRGIQVITSHQGLSVVLVAALHGTLALMLVLDMLSGKRPVRCENCGKVFVSGIYNTRYCSDRCRFVAQKRSYRQRIREAAELYRHRKA